jgi:hypothetical protein
VAHFESMGLPSVGILTTGFASQGCVHVFFGFSEALNLFFTSFVTFTFVFATEAAYQAKALGCEDAVSLFVKHPVSDATPEDLISKVLDGFGFALYLQILCVELISSSFCRRPTQYLRIW